MAAPRGENGWERWRGQIDERVDTVLKGNERIEAAIDDLRTTVTTTMAAHQESDTKQFSHLRERMATLRTRVVLISGGVGVVGGALIDVIVRKIFG